MKQKQTHSAILKDGLNSVFPSFRYLPKSENPNGLTAGRLVRHFGKLYLGNYLDINVWGTPISQNGGNQNGLASLAKKGQSGANLFQLLDDSEIGDNTFLCVGYGDTFSLYGAGPTRDLRRAYYAAGLMVFTPQVEVGGGVLFKSLSKEAARLCDNLENLGTGGASMHGVTPYEEINIIFQSNIFPKNNDWKNPDGSEWGGHLRVVLTNAFRRGNKVMADIGLLLNGPQVSGQYFLPPDVAQTSPFNGSLAGAMGGKDAVTSGPGKELVGWIMDNVQKLNGLAEKIVQGGKKFPLLFADNS